MKRIAALVCHRCDHVTAWIPVAAGSEPPSRRGDERTILSATVPTQCPRCSTEPGEPDEPAPVLHEWCELKLDWARLAEHQNKTVLRAAWQVFPNWVHFFPLWELPS